MPRNHEKTKESKKRWTNEEKEYLREIAESQSKNEFVYGEFLKEMVRGFKEKFGRDRKKKAIVGKYYRLCKKNSATGEWNKRPWSKEEDNFIINFLNAETPGQNTQKRNSSLTKGYRNAFPENKRMSDTVLIRYWKIKNGEVPYLLTSINNPVNQISTSHSNETQNQNNTAPPSAERTPLFTPNFESYVLNNNSSPHPTIPLSDQVQENQELNFSPGENEALVISTTSSSSRNLTMESRNTPTFALPSTPQLQIENGFSHHQEVFSSRQSVENQMENNFNPNDNSLSQNTIATTVSSEEDQSDEEEQNHNNAEFSNDASQNKWSDVQENFIKNCLDQRMSTRNINVAYAEKFPNGKKNRAVIQKIGYIRKERLAKDVSLNLHGLNVIKKQGEWSEEEIGFLLNFYKENVEDKGLTQLLKGGLKKLTTEFVTNFKIARNVSAITGKYQRLVAEYRGQRAPEVESEYQRLIAKYKEKSNSANIVSNNNANFLPQDEEMDRVDSQLDFTAQQDEEMNSDDSQPYFTAGEREFFACIVRLGMDLTRDELITKFRTILSNSNHLSDDVIWAQFQLVRGQSANISSNSLPQVRPVNIPPYNSSLRFLSNNNNDLMNLGMNASNFNVPLPPPSNLNNQNRLFSLPPINTYFFDQAHSGGSTQNNSQARQGNNNNPRMQSSSQTQQGSNNNLDKEFNF